MTIYEHTPLVEHEPYALTLCTPACWQPIKTKTEVRLNIEMGDKRARRYRRHAKGTLAKARADAAEYLDPDSQANRAPYVAAAIVSIETREITNWQQQPLEAPE